jgi:hypothetical protein
MSVYFSMYLEISMVFLPINNHRAIAWQHMLFLNVTDIMQSKGSLLISPYPGAGSRYWCWSANRSVDLNLECPDNLKYLMATTCQPARAHIWHTIQMNYAVVVNSVIWRFARAALLLCTSGATVLYLTAIRMMMEKRFYLLKPSLLCRI